jgi:hypothetical protein
MQIKDRVFSPKWVKTLGENRLGEENYFQNS